MKIGVFAVLFGDKPFEETLDYLVEQGVEAVEIGTGAYPGNTHCDPAVLLNSDRKLRAFREAVSRRGLVISALSCHGNPLHPQARIAKKIITPRSCGLSRSRRRSTSRRSSPSAAALPATTAPRSPTGSCLPGRPSFPRCSSGSGRNASNRTGRTRHARAVRRA